MAEIRHSKALEPELIGDTDEKAVAEARNGLLQYDLGVKIIQSALERGQFKLRPSLIMSLQREALQGISGLAGSTRPAGVEITNSKHKPPGAHLVHELLEEMCDYVNEHWERSTPIHLAAYCMWRLNWIHPFADGNGRTSRIVSYVVMSIKARNLLPGKPTIPDQITTNRQPYFDALDAADAAYADGGRIDVSKMETLLSSLLATQLAEFYRFAGGAMPPGKSTL